MLREKLWFIIMNTRSVGHVYGHEKGGAMRISDCISRGLRGYAPLEIFEI